MATMDGRLNAVRGTTGLMRALDRTILDEVPRVSDLSPGHQESR